MARIIVFNNDLDRMETYTRAESDPMPYNTNGTLRVREFRGSSKSNILWTTKRTMQSWNSQYRLDLHSKDLMKEDMVINLNIMQELHLMLGKHCQVQEEERYIIVLEILVYGHM